MLNKTLFATLAFVALTACEVVPVQTSAPAPQVQPTAAAPILSASQAARSFVQVVQTV